MPYLTSVAYHEMQYAHYQGNLHDLLLPDKTSSEMLIQLLNSPVIFYLHKVGNGGSEAHTDC